MLLVWIDTAGLLSHKPHSCGVQLSHMLQHLFHVFFLFSVWRFKLNFYENSSISFPAHVHCLAGEGHYWWKTVIAHWTTLHDTYWKFRGCAWSGRRSRWNKKLFEIFQTNSVETIEEQLSVIAHWALLHDMYLKTGGCGRRPNWKKNADLTQKYLKINVTECLNI